MKGYRNAAREGRRTALCAAALILLGIAVRTWNFGAVPCGFNQDEAFAAYEAFSLMNYGVDSAGYRNPCYLVTWGSGMNALESYLAIPFMKLFGVSAAVFRLPQLVVGCLSLWVFYLLLKKVLGARTALLGLGLLAISPWHIMLSRWGLESNLAPGFLLFGLYFFVLGVEDGRYWLASAALYGISLYAYSLNWPVVPLTLACFAACIVAARVRFRWSYAIGACGVLLAFALPLILFLLVNKGVIPEIRTAFFSVPKLLYMRDSEVSLRNLFSYDSLRRFIDVFYRQDDGLIWNSTPEFGLYYKFSAPFILLGGARLVLAAKKGAAEKRFCPEMLLLTGAVCAAVTALLPAYLNVNKGNALHLFMLMLLALGVEETFAVFEKYPAVKTAVVAGYAVAFVCFCSFYFGAYNGRIAGPFRDGAGDAVRFVSEQGFDDVCVDASVYHSQVLFFDRTPHDVFAETVRYSNYPAAFLDMTAVGRYTFGIDYDRPYGHRAYILPRSAADPFIEQGYRVVPFGNYAAAYLE